MAQIGEFTRTQKGYAGRVRTLSLDLAVVFVSVDNADVENAPDYRIRVGDEDGIEVGAGWLQTGERAGAWAPLMKGVVEKLTNEDIVAISAFVASQEP